MKVSIVKPMKILSGVMVTFTWDPLAKSEK